MPRQHWLGCPFLLPVFHLAGGAPCHFTGSTPPLETHAPAFPAGRAPAPGGTGRGLCAAGRSSMLSGSVPSPHRPPRPPPRQPPRRRQRRRGPSPPWPSSPRPPQPSSRSRPKQQGVPLPAAPRRRWRSSASRWQRFGRRAALRRLMPSPLHPAGSSCSSSPQPWGPGPTGPSLIPASAPQACGCASTGRSTGTATCTTARCASALPSALHWGQRAFPGGLRAWRPSERPLFTGLYLSTHCRHRTDPGPSAAPVACSLHTER